MQQDHQPGLYDRMSRRLYQIVSFYPVDPIEFVLATAGIGYGVLLLMPVKTFDAGKGFVYVRQFMSETIVALFFLAVGVFFLVGIFLEHRRMRIVASVLSAFCFMLWSIMLGAANFWGMGWFIYGLMAWLGYWSFLRNISRLPV